MGAAVAAIAAAKQRELVNTFTRAGATSPATAVPFDQLGIDPEDRFIRSLRHNNVIRDAGGGRYYIDLDAYRALRKARMRVALMVATIVAIAALVLGVMGRRHG